MKWFHTKKKVDLSKWEPGMGLVLRNESVVFPSFVNLLDDGKYYCSTTPTIFNTNGMLSFKATNQGDIIEMITKEEFDTLYAHKHKKNDC